MPWHSSILVFCIIGLVTSCSGNVESSASSEAYLRDIRTSPTATPVMSATPNQIVTPIATVTITPIPSPTLNQTASVTPAPTEVSSFPPKVIPLPLSAVECDVVGVWEAYGTVRFPKAVPPADKDWWNMALEVWAFT